MYEEKKVIGPAVIYHGKYEDVLESGEIEAGAVDCCVTDMPFSITNLPFDGESVDLETFWKLEKIVCKPSAVCAAFASGKFVHKLWSSNETDHSYNLVWAKTTPTGFLSANRRPLRSHENLLIFIPKGEFYKSTYNPIMTPAEKIFKRGGNRKCRHYGAFRNNVETIASSRYPTDVLHFQVDTTRCDSTRTHEDSYHPTQKPVALLSWLIRTYSDENEVIFDPFAGSGSTGVATIMTGRRCILIEKEKAYYQLAIKNLEAALHDREVLHNVPNLFDQSNTRQNDRAIQVPLFTDVSPAAKHLPCVTN